MSAVKCTLELLLQARWLNYMFLLFCWQLFSAVARGGAGGGGGGGPPQMIMEETKVLIDEKWPQIGIGCSISIFFSLDNY